MRVTMKNAKQKKKYVSPRINVVKLNRQQPLLEDSSYGGGFSLHGIEKNYSA